MPFCLQPEQVEAFKQALLSKKLNLDDLLDPKMTSEERTNIFREYAGDNASEVNRLFESKLVLKNRILGIQNFIKKVGELGRYSPAGKAAAAEALQAYKDAQFERIFSPAENEAFLNDLADKATGVHVSREVAQNIFDLSRKAEALKDIDPKMSGVSDEYLLARNALNAYVAVQKNLNPVADVARNLAITGRNMMLLGVSTPLKVADSTAINTAVDMIGRRVASGTYITDSDVGALASQASQEAWQTFRTTGQNTASMEGLNNAGLGKLGERLSFADIPGSNATGVTGTVGDAARFLARVTNKIAIDWEHNYIFTKAYQTTFFDGAGLLAKNVAEEMGLEPADVFRDAVRIEPETQAGTIVRQAAQQQAMRVLNVNDTILSKISMNIKEGLNKLAPSLRLGDYLVPMAKIPANVIYNSIENAGPGIPLGFRDIVQGKMKIASTDMGTRLAGMMQLQNGYRTLTRTAGVLGTAALFASQVDKKDFSVDHYGNTYVDIAGVRINMEYIAWMSAALAGMLMAKKDAKPGEGILDTAGHYVAGAGLGLMRTPGIDEIPRLFQAISNQNYTKGIVKWGKAFIEDRGVPNIIRNFSPTHPIMHLLFGAHGVETDEMVKEDKAAAALKRARSKLTGVGP